MIRAVLNPFLSWKTSDGLNLENMHSIIEVTSNDYLSPVLCRNCYLMSGLMSRMFETHQAKAMLPWTKPRCAAGVKHRFTDVVTTICLVYTIIIVMHKKITPFSFEWDHIPKWNLHYEAAGSVKTYSCVRK